MFFFILPVTIYFQELEQHSRLYKMKDDDMKHRQDLERKRLPKIQRNDLRQKVQAKRKQLRTERNKRESISIGGLSAIEKEKLKEVKVAFHQLSKMLCVYVIQCQKPENATKRKSGKL